MLGTVEEIDYDGDRLRKVVLHFPALRTGCAEVMKEVRACERIGQGSFGTVYRAVCDGYSRLALKVSTGKSTRLRQELDVLSRVCTKGRLLLPRFEFGALNKTADLIVIGMELCVPSTLHDLLLSTRITSEAEMLFMAYQVVQAVSYVHEEGCIHRDIKLQNFVFDLDGNLKLIDFGLACNSLSPPAGDVVAGTVSFMSPEMAHNALHKDRRVSVGVAADVWSLGIVLFSIFTQRNPYPVDETMASSSKACTRSTSAGASSAQDASHVDDHKLDKENSDANAQQKQLQQQRMNKLLLQRVARGEWQWPVGVSVSEDLKQLVNSILVTAPERRPTVKAILQNKLWNLRRRYPPAAVVAFLGVQDDFLLSHDEAHLMRAVEERSAGVTASLLNSRMDNPSASLPSKNGTDDNSNGHRNANGIEAAPCRHQRQPLVLAEGGEEEEEVQGPQQPASSQHLSGTTTPPLRSSLKVVQRGGEGGVDGAVAVQVYDVRASTRKRSKPIREISVVMAEETAKRSKARLRRRAGEKRRTTAASAPTSRFPSRASSAAGRNDTQGSNEDDVVEEREPRRASSAGASLPAVSRTTRAMFLDDFAEKLEDEVREKTCRKAEGTRGGGGEAEEDVNEIPGPLERAAGASMYLSASRSQQRQSRRSNVGGGASEAVSSSKEEKSGVAQQLRNEDEAATAKSGDLLFTGPSAASAATTATPAPSTGTTQPLLSMTVSSTQSKPPGAVQEDASQRSGSVDLVENGDAEEEEEEEGAEATAVLGALRGKRRQSSASAQLSSRGCTASSRRPRDTSLRQTSSSILCGMTRSLSRSQPTATDSAVAVVVEGVSSQNTETPSSDRPAASLQNSTSADGGAAAHRILGKKGVTAPHPLAPRRGSPLPSARAQRVALELSLNVVWQDEADCRRYLSSVLLLEHEWLLASFRLLIEEDQERYNVTWLAEEQEKSAAHPHRFREMTRVTSKKYQYGFVCDLCDYEFLPDGREKDLHYFHCPCGRDLCPDCFEEYQRQCTCSCCRVVHANSCVLREHLLQTGGTQLYGCLKGVARSSGVSHVEGRGSLESAPATTSTAHGDAAAPAQSKHRLGCPGRSDTPQSSRTGTNKSRPTPPASRGAVRAGKDTGRRRRAFDVDLQTAEEDDIAQIHLPRMSVAAMQQERLDPAAAEGIAERGRTRARANGPAAPPPQRPEDVAVRQRPVEHLPEGPWRPFARFKKDRKDEAARQPTPEERDALLNGEWIRYFYLFPTTAADSGGGRVAGSTEEDPYAFVYHAQPGRTGAIFLTSDFPMHSAVFSMLERQFFVVDQVDTVDGADITRATSLLRAKGQSDLKIAFQALQDIVAYDTNMMKQQRTPGTVSIYQAPRSAYSCNGEPFLYVRWFRFNEDRTLSAFLLSNGAVQVFVNNEYELRWFDENRKFLIRYNGVCELVEDNTFALAPAINHLLYDSFDA